MKYAVIRVQGRQYRVSEGDEILVNKISNEKPQADVLLLVEDGNINLGKPAISKAKLKIRILKEEKGEKIDILKYKAKSRYRRHLGFRPQYTKLLIEKIS